MDDALRRTRRNMIGVSVVLFLVYLLDASFPNDLEVFNYEIPLDASTIEILAWCFLAYLIIEYFVHLRSKFDEITTTRRDHLMKLMAEFVWNDLDPEKRKMAVKKVTDSNPRYEFDKAILNHAQLYRNNLMIQIVPRFIDRTRQVHSHTQGQAINIEYKYSDVRRFRFLAWLKVIFTEGIGFELLIPILYPLAALGALILQKAPLIIDLVSSKSG